MRFQAIDDSLIHHDDSLCPISSSISGGSDVVCGPLREFRLNSLATFSVTRERHLRDIKGTGGKETCREKRGLKQALWMEQREPRGGAAEMLDREEKSARARSDRFWSIFQEEPELCWPL